MKNWQDDLEFETPQYGGQDDETAKNQVVRYDGAGQFVKGRPVTNIERHAVPVSDTEGTTVSFTLENTTPAPKKIYLVPGARFLTASGNGIIPHGAGTPVLFNDIAGAPGMQVSNVQGCESLLDLWAFNCTGGFSKYAEVEMSSNNNNITTGTLQTLSIGPTKSNFAENGKILRLSDYKNNQTGGDNTVKIGFNEYDKARKTPTILPSVAHRVLVFTVPPSCVINVSIAFIDTISHSDAYIANSGISAGR